MRKVTLLVCLFSLLWTAMALADSVTAKDGRVLEGVVIVNGEIVTVKTDNALYQFDKSELTEINASGEVTENMEEGDAVAATGYGALIARVQEAGKPEIIGNEENPQAVIITEKGNIIISLDEDAAPNTVANFVSLTQEGFYDGLTFHRVEPGFVIQGGDPQGDGTGGPGYKIKAEISKLKHMAGAVAMARLPDSINPDRNSSGSQFYVCTEPANFLDNQYTIFGMTLEGMDVARKIAVGDKMKVVILQLRDHEYKPETIAD